MVHTPVHHHKPILREEIANAVSHGIGAALAIAALVVLVVAAARRGDAWHIVSMSIYGASLVLLYLGSTLYHALSFTRARAFFQMLDHMLIFVLIAGTYTPFLLISLRGPWGWSLFGVVWGLAIAGIVLKAFATGRYTFLSTTLYLAMGWLVLIALSPFRAALPAAAFTWLIIGGAFYTLGVMFFAFGHRVPFFHFLWHLCVLGGSASHFVAVWLATLAQSV